MNRRLWNERMLDLRLLEIFCAVYEERSFSRAAARLYLTQPTVSGHIQTLERTLGVRLFDRLGRDILPTAAGELLYEDARRLPELRRTIAERMSRFLGRLEGELRLGASTIPGEYLVPGILKGFRHMYPQVKVRVTISDTERVIEDVERGRVELGIVGARREHRDLEFRAFASDRILLVAPSDRQWAGTRVLSLSALKSMPLLIRERGSGTRAVLEQKLAELGCSLEEFDIVAELGSTSAIKQAVIQGVGLSFLSALAVEHELKCRLLRAVRLRELPLLERPFFLVRHRRRTLAPLSEAFLTFLQESGQRRAG